MPYEIGFVSQRNNERVVEGPILLKELTQAELGRRWDDGWVPICWDCGGEDGPEFYLHEVNNQTFLSCCPGTKPLHREGCSCFARRVPPQLNLDPREGASGIQDDESGFMVKLSTKLVTKVATKPAAAKTQGLVGRSRVHRPGRRAYSATPLGVLEYSLEVGAMTRHDPAAPRSADWTDQAKELGKVLGRGVQADGMPLLEQFVIPHRDNVAEVRRVVDSIKQMEGDSVTKRQVMMAPLEAFAVQGKEAAQLSFEFLDQPAHVTGKAWQRMKKAGHRNGIAQALQRVQNRDHTSHVLVVGTLEHRADGSLWILAAKLVVFSAHWILVDSGHELKAVNNCVARGLKFWKPLRQVKGLGYIPDLIVFLANGRWLVWEIAGFKKPAYLHHLWEKSVRYEDAHPGMWGIWLADSEEMPDFSIIPTAKDTAIWRILKQNV